MIRICRGLVFLERSQLEEQFHAAGGAFSGLFPERGEELVALFLDYASGSSFEAREGAIFRVGRLEISRSAAGAGVVVIV